MYTYNDKIEILKKKVIEEEAKTISMDRYCSINDQKVTICRHVPEEIDGYHAHDFYEINYVKHGECVNFVEESALYMPEGSMIIMHTNVFHSLYSPIDSQIYNVLLRKEWFLDVTHRHPTADTAMGSFISQATGPSYPEYVLFPKVTDVTDKLLTDLYSKGRTATLMLEGGILMCLYEMIADRDARLSDSRRTSDDSMIKMLSYINGNFNTVTLESLSNHIGYSKNHICRMFQKHLGKSFGDVVSNIRLEHAEYLLRTTNQSISAISSSIGYGSVEHFSRLFKKQKGLSPGDYRKRSLSDGTKKQI